MASVDRIQGLSGTRAIKVQCRVATTEHIVLSGLDAIPGITLVSGDRVLVRYQNNAAENGIYVADTGYWKRAEDFDGANDVVRGTLVPVLGDGIYQLTTAANPIRIGTDPITLEVYSAAGTPTPYAALQRELLIAVGGETTIPLTEPFTGSADGLLFYRDGVLQPDGYSLNSPTEVAFTPAATAAEEIEVIYFNVAGVSAAVVDVAAISAEVATVAGIAGDVTAVAGISADVTTVAANVTDVTNFSDVYQGPKTSDPATRNDSSALQAGDLYFNTVSGRMRVYSGSVWADTAPTATSITSTQISDSTTTGRAVLTAADAAAARSAIGAQATAVPSLQKADKTTPCLVKTGGGTLAVKAGTTVYLSGGVVSFASQTAVTMPTLTAGEDYSVWVLPNGTAQAVADPFSAPASAPVSGAIKIGGFHYGLVTPGTTPASGGFSTSGFSDTGGNMVWTQADVDRIAGINEFSIWDLTFRSKGEQHGMTFDPQTRVWWGIYLCSSNHIANGISRYNTDVASGTVLPRIPLAYGGDGTITYGRLSLYEAVEIAASHNCRLPSYEEFMSAAFGVTEGQSLGGSSVTIPATAREPGFTSRIGMEQATGHIRIIGAPFGTLGGSEWLGTGRGALYGTSGLSLFGGARNSGANSGSRCSSWNDLAWYSSWLAGLRAVCDHYQEGI